MSRQHLDLSPPSFCVVLSPVLVQQWGLEENGGPGLESKDAGGHPFVHFTLTNMSVSHYEYEIWNVWTLASFVLEQPFHWKSMCWCCPPSYVCLLIVLRNVSLWFLCRILCHSLGSCSPIVNLSFVLCSGMRRPASPSRRVFRHPEASSNTSNTMTLMIWRGSWKSRSKRTRRFPFLSYSILKCPTVSCSHAPCPQSHLDESSLQWWSVQGAGGQALRRFLSSRNGLGCPLEVTVHLVASKRITFYVCVTVLMSVFVSPAESP